MAHSTEDATKRFDDLAKAWDERPDAVKLAKVSASLLAAQPWWSQAARGNGAAVEVGCGTGLLSMLLLDQLDKVVGVDVSQGMIDAFQKKIDASSRSNDLAAVVVDLQAPLSGDNTKANTLLQPNSFDLALSQLAMHHIPDVPTVLSQVGKLLKKGGRLAFLDFERNTASHRFHPKDFKEGKELERHGVTEEEIRRWIESTGLFTDIQVVRSAMTKVPGPGHSPSHAQGHSHGHGHSHDHGHGHDHGHNDHHDHSHEHGHSHQHGDGEPHSLTHEHGAAQPSGAAAEEEFTMLLLTAVTK